MIAAGTGTRGLPGLSAVKVEGESYTNQKVKGEMEMKSSIASFLTVRS